MIRGFAVAAAGLVLLCLMASTATAVTIAQAKIQPNGATVDFAGVVTFASGSVCVVEDPNRSCAIRVFWSGGLVVEGTTVDVTGIVGVTTQGEACISASDVHVTGSASLFPFFMYGKILGGADFFYSPGPPERGQKGVYGGNGLNNVGLLVKIAGRVTAVEPRPTGEAPCFWVDDGSGVGVGSYQGICVTQSQPLDLQVGDSVHVTGVSTCYKDSNGKLRPAVQMLSVEPVFPARPYFIVGMNAYGDGHMILYTPVRDAVDYRLYESFDGVNWSLRPETSVPILNQAMSISLTIPTNRYLRVVPANSAGVEGAPSHTVNARVEDPRIPLTITSPTWDQTGVSRSPSIAWDSIPGAEMVMVDISESTQGGPGVWNTIALFPAASVTYGNYRGTYLQAHPATGPLAPNAEHWVYVAAFDSGRWGMTSGDDVPFTTGP
jgi:hypothetical protein